MLSDEQIERALAKATPPPYIELVMGANGPRIWWEGCAPEAWADAERHRYTLVDDPQLMLIGVLADIRMVTGLREKPMLDELAAEIGRLIAAKDAEIERHRKAAREINLRAMATRDANEVVLVELSEPERRYSEGLAEGYTLAAQIAAKAMEGGNDAPPPQEPPA